ncbi:Mechanosensitive ion channel [Paenimyroides ummariense]|uniref:Mechanosensitive ion channel n=1 Tax=Paenimyroides ummariense TaxID=913024 RepID=A0A1I5CTU2_9FLAO|nr:mechanosensitive ion channel family protein [Paenimyroides ummariense]SFN90266.1 Mechanosensitive ion channel [Paenimyroides ummariense]
MKFNKRSIIKFLLLLGVTYLQLSMCASAQVKGKKPSHNVSLFSQRDTTDVKNKDYVEHIEKAFLEISEIQEKISVPVNRQNAINILKTEELINIINASIKLHSQINARDLQLYLKLLNNSEREQNRLKTDNFKLDTIFKSARKSLYDISADPVLAEIASVMSIQDREKLNSLSGRWASLDSIIAERISLIDQQGIQLSTINIQLKDLQKQTRDLLFESNIATFKKTNAKPNNSSGSGGVITQSQINAKIVGMYMQDNLFLFVFLPILLVSIVYYWTNRKVRFVKDKVTDTYLSSVFSEGIFMRPFTHITFMVLNLVPLLDLNTPSFYQFLIQSLSVFMFVKMLDKQERKKYGKFYLGFFALYIVILFLNAQNFTVVHKVVLTIVSISTAVIAVILMSKGIIKNNVQKTYGIISLLIILTTLLSLFCLFTNRVLVSYNLIYASIVCVLQLICLFKVKDIILDLLKLQMLQRRLKLAIDNTVNTSNMVSNLSKPLNISVYIFCSISFISNLNLYVALESLIDAIMDLPINIGSIHITAGSIIYFIIIVFIAHFIRKHIGYVFGNVGIEEEDEKFEQSSLVITRLLIICLGYIIAVAASGLPVDKITVVLGALSVGVGMGFQNIVNNFVSGLILLFERPLKIGDNVQINGKSGRVKEMGVRTSTLQTDEGAEVIIPNGTILSQDIINWSYKNNKRRVELSYSIKSSKNAVQLEAFIVNCLVQIEDVLSFPKPTVLFDTVSEEDFKIRIQFWFKDSGNFEKVMSNTKSFLYTELKQNEMFVQ